MRGVCGLRCSRTAVVRVRRVLARRRGLVEGGAIVEIVSSCREGPVAGVAVVIRGVIGSHSVSDLVGQLKSNPNKHCIRKHKHNWMGKIINNHIGESWKQ